MNRKYILILFFLVLTPITLAIGQQNQMTGLWGVEKVSAGDQEMTPIAKWFRINEDGTFESGNGWMQNSEGIWEFDGQNYTYLPTTKNGLVDKFGAFYVQFEDKKMLWQREEEGVNVKVTLSQLNELPKAPADLVQGLWDLEQILEHGNDITADFDPDNRFYLFIRWDRIYVQRSAEGERSTGYWHMNGHRPEMTLMSHQEGIQPETWSVKADASNLVLTGTSDLNQNIEMSFHRLHEFPE